MRYMMEFIAGKYRAISTFSLLSLDRYHTAAGISVADGIIHPVVTVSAPTWFIGYIYYYCNLQFLNNVITNLTEFLLPQAYAIFDDISHPV
jgi:hypothetical protein